MLKKYIIFRSFSLFTNGWGKNECIENEIISMRLLSTLNRSEKKGALRSGQTFLFVLKLYCFDLPIGEGDP